MPLTFQTIEEEMMRHSVPPPLMSQRAIPPNVRVPPPQGPMVPGQRGSLLGQPPPGQFIRGPFDPRNAISNVQGPHFGGQQGSASMNNSQVLYLLVT